MTIPDVAPPARVNQVIFKIVQNCNLDCTYCYVYNRGDESWRSRPRLASDVVAGMLARRIAEHCTRYNISNFTVELHGGEPLLLGKDRMQSLLDTLRVGANPVKLRIILQTNGLLLDEDWIEFLSRNEICFGVSLDGPPELADRFRIRHDGRGSTAQLLEIIHRLRDGTPLFNEWFGGFLCVVNPETNGASLVDWFVGQGFDTFDFLLPDGNRSNLPQRWTGEAPYRRFLLEAFDRWYGLGSNAPRIRKFELMMMGLMGIDVPLDSLGGDLSRLCVVESDGSIGVNDVARICGGDFSMDVLSVFHHSLNQHAERYRIAEIQKVCAECQGCPHLRSCGGGYLPHRFDGLGFDNPSIYCEALYALSERMTEMLRADLPLAAWVTSAQSDAENRGISS